MQFAEFSEWSAAASGRFRSLEDLASQLGSKAGLGAAAAAASAEAASREAAARLEWCGAIGEDVRRAA